MFVYPNYFWASFLFSINIPLGLSRIKDFKYMLFLSYTGIRYHVWKCLSLIKSENCLELELKVLSFPLITWMKHVANKWLLRLIDFELWVMLCIMSISKTLWQAEMEKLFWCQFIRPGLILSTLVYNRFCLEDWVLWLLFILVCHI